MIHVWLPTYYSLYNNILDFSHYFVGICSLGVKNLENSEETPLVSLLLIAVVVVVFIIVIAVFVLLFSLSVVLSKVCIHLVNGIVGQVHEHVVHITIFGLLVWLGRKPSQTLLMDENTKWVQPI
jgi:hypothetical protein